MIQFRNGYLELIEKLAECTVMIGLDRALILGCRQRMRMIVAATGGMIVMGRFGTVRMQSKDMGAMQGWPQVQQENQVAKEKAIKRLLETHL